MEQNNSAKEVRCSRQRLVRIKINTVMVVENVFYSNMIYDTFIATSQKNADNLLEVAI